MSLLCGTVHLRSLCFSSDRGRFRFSFIQQLHATVNLTTFSRQTPSYCSLSTKVPLKIAADRMVADRVPIFKATISRSRQVNGNQNDFRSHTSEKGMKMTTKKTKNRAITQLCHSVISEGYCCCKPDVPHVVKVCIFIQPVTYNKCFWCLDQTKHLAKMREPQ